MEQFTSNNQTPWTRLRGALKDVYAEMGGGEEYLRAERESLRDSELDAPKESK